MSEPLDDLQDVLGEGVLTHVTLYHLDRGSGPQFDIRVLKVITGPHMEKYLAMPWALMSGKPVFFGKGTTSSEALRDCLGKIKDVPFEDIFRQGGF